MKWQKETFQNLEIDTSQPPIVFKGQLFALTGVPTDRQKIMVKGGLLQVGAWLGGCVGTSREQESGRINSREFSQ